MAVRYLIDGYNLMHALGLMPTRNQPQGLHHARLRFLDRLHDSFQPDPACLTVVFDARTNPSPAPSVHFYRTIKLLFAPGNREADDVIADLISDDTAPNTLSVVSSDHLIQQSARRRGARFMTSDEFIDLLAEARRTPSTTLTEPSEKGEEPSAEEKQRWLEEFGYLDRDPDLDLPFDQRNF